MARLLIERETIYGEEVYMVMEGKTLEEILEYIEHKESANPLEKAMKKEAEETNNATQNGVDETSGQK